MKDGVTAYLVVIEDRHIDPEYHLYLHEDAALAFAKKTAAQLCNDHDKPYQEKNYGDLFFVNFSCEGDHVRMVGTFLDMAFK